MRAITRTIVPALLTTAVLVLPSAAAALSTGGYSMEILVDGIPMSELAARGTTYIEARQGAEYAVRLRNHSGHRVAIALSVDGLNSIDARTTSARRARKWVLGPWETITIGGWQTSTDTARRFFFTTEDRSYGSWLGRTDHLGVIEAVVFRERRPPQVSRPMTEEKAMPGAPSPESGKRSADLGETESDDLAATGIGREVDHQVRQVEFRAESGPAASLRLRYEYRPQLVHLGVLPWPGTDLERRERARGFTDTGFAPHPWESTTRP